MHLICKAFQVPKASSEIRACEDYYCPQKLRRGFEPEAFPFRVALSDGASTSIFSREWAAQLARAYCRRRIDQSHLDLELRALGSKWLQQVFKEGLPWYLDEKISIGAFATLLGLSFEARSPDETVRKWNAIALGDSCLFQIRKNRLKTAFPEIRAGDFWRNPVLASTNPTSNQNLSENVKTKLGTWRINDKFYLMTDALAFWFVSSIEQGEKPWTILDSLDTEDELAPFEVWIPQLRREGAMPNDDVTLIRVDVG